MKKSLLVFFLLTPLLLQAKLQGQARVDSLLNELPKAKEDTNKVKLLNTLSFGLGFIDPGKGLKYGMDGLALAEQLNWQKGVAGAYNSLSNNYYQKSDYHAAMESGIKSLNINEEAGDKRAIAANLGNIANSYDALGNFAKSLEYNLKGLKIAEQIDDKKLTATSLMNIGNTYIEFNDYKKALQYYLMALKKEEERGDEQHIAHCMANIGSTYYLQKNNTKALEYDLGALRLCDTLGDMDGIQSAEENAGSAYLAQGNYVQALDFAFKALKTGAETGNKEANASELAEVGDAYLKIAKDTGSHIHDERIPADKKANLDLAIQYLEKGVAIGKEINALTMLMDASQNLAEAYKLSGKYSEALESYEAYTKIKDSIFSTDNKVKVANLETKREEELKDKEILINKLATIQKRNERILFVTGLALLVVIIAAVYKNYTSQKKAKEKQQVTNKLLEEALIQKEMLMREVHHRVKNNLQVISTLLDLQLVNISDAYAKDAITESTTRLKAISLIHHQLYRDAYKTTIECAQFATDLHYQVSTIFINVGQHITLHNETPPITLDIDTAVPLGLILNELMTNSYKYAFKGTNGSIDLKIEKQGDAYMLRYHDSGPGLPVGLDIKALKSLGIMIMESLSKQIGGSFSYVAETKTFIITFRDTMDMKKMA